MRVALFTETFLPKIDGQATITCLLLEHLRRIDADAILFAAGDRVDEYAGYPVVSMRGIPAFIYPGIELALPGPRVKRRLAAFEPDVVHILNPVMSGLRAIQFAKALNVPLVMSFHTHLMELSRFYGWGVFEGVLWALHRMAYRHADRVLATSEHTANDLKAHGFGHVDVWRRGVDTVRFAPTYVDAAMRYRLTDGNPQRPLLLSVGRLAPEKQIEQIAHALDALPGAHLAIVGDGPHRPTLERTFAGCPVTFTGPLTGDDLSAAYASADLFVFPSSSIETFGLVAAEAMASGVPVVASAVGGMPEIIAHGENSYLFPENDTVQMAALVAHLIAHPAKRRAMGARARETLVHHLSWTAIMDELFELYADLIAAKQGGYVFA